MDQTATAVTETAAAEVTAPPAQQPPVKNSKGRSERPQQHKAAKAAAAGGAKKKKSKEGALSPREKRPAEEVLPDPRIRETRALLINACGMAKEREEKDAAFEEETKRLGRARTHLSDGSSAEKEDDKEEKLKKKKKKKDEEVRERYHNENKTADSPNAKTPEASSAMLEELDYELRVGETTHVKKLTTWKLVAVLLSNFFRLPVFLVVTKYYVTYGISFIGVCGLMMLAVGIPTIFLEMSMGQFTSLPPNTFFARISPITQGVGISMILLRVFAMICIHVDIRYLVLFFEHISLLSSKTDYRCEQSGMPFCRTATMCEPEQEPGMYGSCLERSNLDVPFKDRILGEVMEIRALQSSPAQLLVDNELAGHNMYTMTAYLLVFLAAGVPLIDGAELFATMAPYLMVASFATPIVIFWKLEMDEGLSKWRSGWHGGMDGFSDPFAWIVAFCLVCCMFNVGEGTWMFIGSWLNIRHKQALRSLLYTVAAQLLLTLMMSFVLCAWAVNVLHWQHNGFLEHGEMMEILRDRPLEFWLTLPIKVIPDKKDSLMFTAYLLFTINSLGYVITTGEYLIVSLVRAFPFFVRCSKVELRAIALLILISLASILVPFLIDAHIFRQARVHHIYVAMLTIIILYEIMILVYIYGIQRVLVNLKMIYRPDPPSIIRYSRATSYLKLCYRFILTWLLMLGFAHASDYFMLNNFSLLSCLILTVTGMPWIVAFYKIARHSETTHSVVTLFRSDPRFGPSAVNDRKEAQKEENKMGSMGLS